MNDLVNNNISYVSKDFNKIYEELLDIAKTLSPIWDPTASNESDPGVLLIKLMALCSDKNNYNIDKNTLECFPLSVTQIPNARKIYDILGYRMNWYISANTQIGFTLKPWGSTEQGQTYTHTVKRFTKISDPSNTNVYVLTEDVGLTNDTPIEYRNVIQGIIKDYEINGETTIVSQDLDENLRLYFTESQIAQNGIFISNLNQNNWDDWHQVENVVSYESGKLVYEFGVLPNTNTCYLQFPQDIEILMGDGINVKYIVSKGTEGNVKAFTINSFYSDELAVQGDGGYNGQDTLILNDYIIITQPNPTLNGRDPETLKEAYNNYKKQVGTFNTLVTKKDYESFCYNAEDYISRDNLISNLVVADRTNDINASSYITTWTPFGDEKILSTPDVLQNSKSLSAYDVMLYLLNPINNIINSNTYMESFKKYNGYGIISVLESLMDEVKSAQHDIYQGSDIDSEKVVSKYICNNLYALKGKVITYSKVTTTEKKQIESNILTALFMNYNARKVSFGSPISYADLIETIQNADTRIKSVSLAIPEYDIKYQSNNPLEIDLKDITDDFNNEMIAKSVLSGRLQLYDFTTGFNFDFGQTNGQVTSNVETITTNVDIFKTDIISEYGYTLKENESVNILSPNYIATTKYSNYVKYTYSGQQDKSVASDSTIIQLQGTITFTYTDNNGVTQNKVYNNPKIRTSLRTIYGGNIPTSIPFSDYIEIVEKNEVDLKNIYSYWIMNNQTNNLKVTSDNPIILGQNEYFLYTDKNYSNLVILGSGTQLSVKNASDNIDMTCTRIKLEDVNSQGMQTIEWQTISNITTTEMEIISLGKDDNISGITFTEAGVTEINNTPKSINSIEYTIGQNASIELTSDSLKPYQVVSILNLNMSKENPQLLDTNQSIILDNNSPINGSANTYIQSNEPLILAGGKDIDLSVINEDIDLDIATHEELYPYSFYAYTYTQNTDYKRTNDIITQDNDSGEVKYSYNYDTEHNIYLIPIHLSVNEGEITLTDCHIYNPYDNSTNNAQLYKQVETPTAQEATDKPYYYALSGSDYYEVIAGTDNEDTYNSDDTFYMQQSGSYILQVDNNPQDSSFKITCGGDAVVKIGHIFICPHTPTYSKDIQGNNPIKWEDGTGYKGIKTYMETFDPDNKFDWTYIVNEKEKITQPTESESYWNTNHLYNKWTIPEIDLKNTEIKVDASSLK